MFPPNGSSAYRLAMGNSPKPVRPYISRGRQFMSRNPLLFKAIPCAFGFVFGDLLTQLGQHSRSRRASQPFSWELHKAAMMAVVGATVAAPVGLYFLRWAEIAILPGATGPLASGLRLTLEQILGCVVWQGAYLSMCEQYRKDAKWCLDHCMQQQQQQQQLQPLQQQQQPATESMAA